MDNWVYVQYHFVMDEMTPTQWIAKCAERLHERWQTLQPTQLEEVAIDIWRDPAFRSLSPVDAATAWLRPLPARVKDVAPL